MPCFAALPHHHFDTLRGRLELPSRVKCASLQCPLPPPLRVDVSSPSSWPFEVNVGKPESSHVLQPDHDTSSQPLCPKQTCLNFKEIGPRLLSSGQHSAARIDILYPKGEIWAWLTNALPFMMRPLDNAEYGLFGLPGEAPPRTAHSDRHIA